MTRIKSRLHGRRCSLPIITENHSLNSAFGPKFNSSPTSISVALDNSSAERDVRCRLPARFKLEQHQTVHHYISVEITDLLSSKQTGIAIC
jgi:hypothetical protein